MKIIKVEIVPFNLLLNKLRKMIPNTFKLGKSKVFIERIRF